MQVTRIKPGGWIIILALLAFVFYGVRAVRQRLAPPAAGSVATTTTGPGNSTTAPTLSPAEAAGGDILVSTTKTKQQWMQAEIDKFNAQSQTGKARLQLAESREAMQGILNSKIQPTVWSPSSPIWTSRVVDYWPQIHSGQKIGDLSSGQDYRVLFKSPLVFVTTKAKAGFLRPLLGGPAPWESVRRLSLGQQKCPWGRFKFAYADPLNASSGTLTMSLIITEYARTHGGGADLVAAAGSPGFAAYLSQINRAYVQSKASGGSSSLESAFSADPNSRDFITAYENAALAALSSHPNLALIYPSPTATASQGVLILSAPWVSANQTKTAHAFLDFLGRPEATDDGIQYSFRPAQEGGGQTLADSLAPAVKYQYQTSPTFADLAPYDALNEAASRWKEQMK